MKSDEMKEAMKESPGRYTNPFLSDEENEKVNFWNNQELEHSKIKDDFTNNREEEKFRKSLAPCNVPSEFFEKETELYTDKNVMEYELPKLLVCYKESAFHIKDICVDEGMPHGEKILFAKDNHEIVCNSSAINEDKHDDLIEGSLHTQFLKPERLRFGPMEDCYMNSDLCSGTKEKGNTDLLIVELTNDHRDVGDNLDEMIEENLDIQPLKGERMRSSSREDCYAKSATSSGTEEVDNDLPIRGPTNDHRNLGNVSIETEIPVQDGPNSIPGKDCEGDATKECGTKEKVVIDTVISNGLHDMSKVDTVSKATDNCDPEMLMQTGEQSNSMANLLDNASTEQVASSSMPSLQQYQPLPSLKFLLESSDNVARDVDQQPCESSVEEISERPLVGYDAEELGRSCYTTNVSNESTMEGNITSNVHNGEPATSSGNHGAENPECVHELPLGIQSAPNHQDVASDNVSMANPMQHGEGESSFSVAGPVSGLITYSGPIAFSGSVSLRSDSSTTSTRSFAFPILQTEWNSSPVRMAKADRRRLQKHRGWRHGLLCCRF